MKRSELTVAIMKDRGWIPTDPNQLRLKDIVFNIQECEEWRHLRCTTDTSEVYSDMEYNMCSTYKVLMHKEYLEVSTDNKKWFKIAYRFVVFNKVCTYAD